MKVYIVERLKGKSWVPTWWAETKNGDGDMDQLGWSDKKREATDAARKASACFPDEQFKVTEYAPLGAE